MARVRMLCGPRRSERRAFLDALIQNNWGRAVLLAPTRTLAQHRLELLVIDGGLPGAWGRPVLTFQDFVVSLLRSEGHDATPIGDLERRILLDRVVAELANTPAFEALGDAARTNGFITHIQRIITQLKQAAVDPEVFRERIRKRRTPSFLDDVVSEVYTAYQQALVNAGAYDVVGLYWEAELLCKQRRPAALEQVRVLALDQFDDFTPSEFRLLEAIENHVDELVFGLSYPPDDPSQTDLYALPLKTATAIRNTFPDVQHETFSETEPKRFTEFAASQLFWRQPPTLPPQLVPDLELVPYSTAIHEIEATGRRVKALLVDQSVAADEIAVVYRHLRGVAGAVRAVFDEFGIPVHVSESPAVAESAVCTFLLTVLEATQTWEREAVLDVLTSPWFRPENAPGRSSVDAFRLLSRTARIVSGYAEWNNRIEHVCARLDRADDDEAKAVLEHAPNAAEAARALPGLLETLRDVAKLIPAKATPQGFVEGIEAVIEICGIQNALSGQETAVEDIRIREQAAFDALYALLGRFHAGFAGPEHGARLSRSDFMALFRQALGDTSFEPPQPRHGDGVLCTDADRIRHLRFDHVFFCGVNEGEVPAPPATSAIYSDDDIRELERLGVVLEGREQHADRERLMFQQVLEAARKHLCLSWRTISGEDRPILPSPFVADLVELFPGEKIRRQDPEPSDFVPGLSTAASPRDLANAVFAGGNAEQQALLGDELGSIRRGVEIETRRHQPEPFDGYDGVLSDPRRIESLGDRYGPSRPFSVSRLETYAQCPFQFFVDYVLGIAELDTPAAEFDARVRGSIMHEVLRAFHAHFRGKTVSDIPEPEARDVLREILDDVFDRRARRSVTAPAGLVTVEKQRMAKTLGRYLALERELGQEPWKPQHFEVSFGQVPRPSTEEPARAEPFPLDTPAGKVLFAGQIDRIDLREEHGAAARIIDYKSFVRTSPKQVTDGVALQLGVYALALQEFLLEGLPCEEAWFAHVGRDRPAWHEVMARGGRSQVRWDQREQILRDSVGHIVTEIRAGHFPPTPYEKACSYCSARAVCRHEPGRIEQKRASNKKTSSFSFPRQAHSGVPRAQEDAS